MPRYPNTLNDRDVLALIRAGVYRVDLDEGAVYNQRGRLITPFEDGEGYRFIRLYAKGQYRRAIGLSRLVWMAGTNSTVPRRFEIHHRDEDVSNNSFRNLLCFHKVDHRKMHEELETVPF